ncbi:hypothetical protein EQG49_12310 [Periweissella cryptocerci]|uniref:Bacterial Ig domain-containing protein n=1 Tax=Periweissella cryptocerci TaxID=2506420 RepID=A0A4P6YWK9_9LACO|nr:Ig-like domain-containing protein [Periweissella cryptocerci]QBO37181.1 hypothetical protein EQG49_12310 [Periweissella cryptocerci]
MKLKKISALSLVTVFALSALGTPVHAAKLQKLPAKTSVSALYVNKQTITGSTAKGATIKLAKSNGKLVKQVKANKKGNFKLKLTKKIKAKKNQNFKVTITKKGYKTKVFLVKAQAFQFDINKVYHLKKEIKLKTAAKATVTVYQVSGKKQIKLASKKATKAGNATIKYTKNLKAGSKLVIKSTLKKQTLKKTVKIAKSNVPTLSGIAKEYFAGTINLKGKSLKNATIKISYQTASGKQNVNVKTDKQGKFTKQLKNVAAGTTLSARVANNLVGTSKTVTAKISAHTVVLHNHSNLTAVFKANPHMVELDLTQLDLKSDQGDKMVELVDAMHNLDNLATINFAGATVNFNNLLVLNDQLKSNTPLSIMGTFTSLNLENVQITNSNFTKDELEQELAKSSMFGYISNWNTVTVS